MRGQPSSDAADDKTTEMEQHPPTSHIFTPGELIATIDDPSINVKLISGIGTYVIDHSIYASRVGTLETAVTPEISSSPRPQRVTRRYTIARSGKLAADEVVPSVGAVVVGRVVRLSSRLAEIEILCVGESPLSVERRYKGTLRKENVREFEVDLVDMFASFRLGDVVRCRVAALGTARTYELSTAGDEFGVIHARSSSDREVVLRPISWTEMQDPLTGEVERRKVAKVM